MTIGVSTENLAPSGAQDFTPAQPTSVDPQPYVAPSVEGGQTAAATQPAYDPQPYAAPTQQQAVNPQQPQAPVQPQGQPQTQEPTPSTDDGFVEFYQKALNPIGNQQQAFYQQPQQQFQMPMVPQQFYTAPAFPSQPFMQPQQFQQQQNDGFYNQVQQQVQQQVQNVQQQIADGNPPAEIEPIDINGEELLELLNEDPAKFTAKISEIAVAQVMQNINPDKMLEQILPKVNDNIKQQEEMKQIHEAINTIATNTKANLAKDGIQISPLQERTIYAYASQREGNGKTVLDNNYENYAKYVQAKAYTGQQFTANEINADGTPFSEVQFAEKFITMTAKSMLVNQQQPQQQQFQPQGYAQSQMVKTTLNPVHSGGLPQQAGAQRDLSVAELTNLSDEQRGAYAKSKGWGTL